MGYSSGRSHSKRRNTFGNSQRELQEELGLNLKEFDIEKVDRIKEQFNNNGIVSNEYVTIYLVCGNMDLSKINLQEEEVSEAKWCTKNELNELIKQQKIIPHMREYEILNELLND